MNISSFTVSLTVDNIRASGDFLIRHFNFQEKASAEGFISLTHASSGINVIYLTRGIEVLPENFRDKHATGVILAFESTNIEEEETRLKNEGVEIYMPLRTESWGEKLFQVVDSNGIVIQLVEWVK